MSGDPEQEYFADGITEDVITDLSKIGGLLVTAKELHESRINRITPLPLFIHSSQVLRLL